MCGFAAQNDSRGDIGAGDGEFMVGGLGAAGLPFGKRLHAQLLPELLDGLPGSLDPAAVFVRTIPPLFPLRTRREEFGVVGHVEFCTVFDSPTVFTLVSQQDRVGVDFSEYLQITFRLDFQNSKAVWTELVNPVSGILGNILFRLLPIRQISPHEGSTNYFSRFTLLNDDRIKLEAAVNIKDFVPIFEAKEPFPMAFFHK